MIRHLLCDWPDWGLEGPMPGLKDFHPLPKGLTNQCWRLDLNHRSVVIRASAANTRLLDIDRSKEYRIQQWAAGLDLAPRIVYRSPGDRYWVMDYLSGRQATTTSQDLRALAGRLRLLHLGRPPTDLSYWQLEDKAAVYWQTIESRGGSLPQLKEPLQNLLSAMPGTQRSICHMDTHLMNWRHTTTGWKMLDWEYATLSHPYWDLAGFVASARLGNRQTETWCQYHNIDTANPGWQLARLQMAYLVTLWYGVQGMHSIQQIERSLEGLLNQAERLMDTLAVGFI